MVSIVFSESHFDMPLRHFLFEKCVVSLTVKSILMCLSEVYVWCLQQENDKNTCYQFDFHCWTEKLASFWDCGVNKTKSHLVTIFEIKFCLQASKQTTNWPSRRPTEKISRSAQQQARLKITITVSSNIWWTLIKSRWRIWHQRTFHSICNET